MLHIIGMGLYDENDLSLRAIEALRASEKVYFESYTSRYNGDLERLSELIGKEVVPLRRADLEEHPEENVLKNGGDTSLLTMGDPLAATTHSDLILRAHKAGVEVKVIHNASIYSAVAETGLQLYMFGRTVTIPYPEGRYFPTSPYDGLRENKTRGLHTLCLLDVKAEEGRYMTVNEAVDLLLRMECERMQNQFSRDTLCVGVARLGGDSLIRCGSAEEVMSVDFGGPPHVLVVPGRLHFIEEEMLARFRL